MTNALRGPALFLCLLALAAGAQARYDASAVRSALPAQVPSPAAVSALDLGLHGALAALAWIGVRAELPFLPDGAAHFEKGIDFVNALDPRLASPYIFTVLVLPSVSRFPDRIATALAIGERGLAQADPSWQIPFYMGTVYQLELHDRENAARLYDIAATTPGIPDLVRRFAVNYGIAPESLAETLAAWKAIAASAVDPGIRERADAHVAHLEILAILDAAAAKYRDVTGSYPATTEDLVARHIIPEIPADPLGFTFKMYPNGVAGIAPPSP